MVDVFERMRKEEKIRSRVILIMLLLVTFVIGIAIISISFSFISDYPQIGQSACNSTLISNFSIENNPKNMDELITEIAKYKNYNASNLQVVTFENNKICNYTTGYWIYVKQDKYRYLVCSSNVVFEYKIEKCGFDFQESVIRAYNILKDVIFRRVK